MFRTNRFFQNLILMMCVLFDMGCTSIQKPLTTPIEQTPSPMTIFLRYTRPFTQPFFFHHFRCDPPYLLKRYKPLHPAIRLLSHFQH